MGVLHTLLTTLQTQFGVVGNVVLLTRAEVFLVNYTWNINSCNL